MGEEVRGIPEAPSLKETEERPEPSIGRYLAAQRRLRGFSLEELAWLTKIPLRSLERLEAGAFDRSSDGFARGFVRTVAGALGLDPDETVNRLLSEPLVSDDEVAPQHLAMLRWGLVAGAALLVIALVLGVRTLTARRAETAAEETTPVVYRHDAVRALAEASEPADGLARAEPGPQGPELPSAGGEPSD